MRCSLIPSSVVAVAVFADSEEEDVSSTPSSSKQKTAR
jgi:hypothetical protein